MAAARLDRHIATRNDQIALIYDSPVTNMVKTFTYGRLLSELQLLGAMLRDFDQLLREETKLPIVRGDDPLTAVAMGAGKALESLDLLREVAMDD